MHKLALKGGGWSREGGKVGVREEERVSVCPMRNGGLILMSKGGHHSLGCPILSLKSVSYQP